MSPWWRSAVVYQVYVRSFLDGDGDGVGDLAGLTAGLDAVARLGVDAVWLTPVYRSPQATLTDSPAPGPCAHAARFASTTLSL